MQSVRRLMNRLFVAAAVAAWLGGALPAAAAGISVQGNHRIDSDTIDSYFAGSDQDSVNKGVKALYATGLFSNVRVLHEGGRVVIVVTENNVINRVAFEGNSKVKTEILTSEVQSKSRGPYSQATVDADIERIKDAYRRSGRAAAKVTARTVDLPNGKLDVVFTIDEGDKTGVKQINFVGNQVFSSGKLRDLMQTTEMNFMSFFKTSDVYDPDRIASDLELIRRFYLKNGYADFRVIGSDAQYNATEGGYVITITVEEGPQYTVSAVDIESHLPSLDAATLRPLLRLAPGEIYNGDMVEKTVDAMTREVTTHGFAFSQVRPRGDRDPAAHTVAIVFVVEEGPKVYVERIVVRGNTRTRDYVIRREFEIGEGDAYNRVLIERAERRLNNLGYFKKVKITNEQGSAPDRVIVIVDVEDQPTGSLSVSGGYSTSDGFIAEVAVTETNFMGRGQYVRLSVSEGQYARGAEFSFTEPYFLGNRLAAGFDIYAKQSSVSSYSYYNNFVTGGTVRFGLPITDEITFSPRYSLFNTYISIPNNSSYPYNDCNSPIWGTTPGTYNWTTLSYSNNCLSNGEASLALKQAAGNTLTSMFGYTLSYNTLDNNKSPTGGILAELRQDIAGAGGQSQFIRTTGDIRYYREIFDQVVGIVHLQGGDIFSYGGNSLRIVDNFNLGPSLVRGFAPNGIGPRDVSSGYYYSSGNALGGTSYVGASAEVQFPIWGLPRDIGLKGALFADAGSLWNYTGKTNFSVNGVCTPNNAAPLYTQGNCVTLGGNSFSIRSSVGASIIWASPLGPIRFDFAKALTKDNADQTQFFRFTGGTTF
ncbi:outer membrane protein assembly factor BamA [Methylocella silvestris]|uniref:Outer membrane protein assembly factor BamA n=1 Tax=Methylocella silvestris TaxID=199596 RepID=A0A2J7TM58_METSI|nr:outer membrane protein assembly factor BamA [Methylocella silvestris]PNG27852.1 outer membrane protein assembly factor BamA [Methylocella silvestris]